jgi:hypothetical protein
MSTAKFDTLQNAAGSVSVPVNTVVNGSAKAWVNFNGTTTPPTVRASFNVSSVTRSSTGIFVINFIAAMPDTNYSTTFGGGDPANAAGVPLGYAQATTTSSLTFAVYNYSSGGLFNSPLVNLAIFR